VVTKNDKALAFEFLVALEVFISDGKSAFSSTLMVSAMAALKHFHNDSLMAGWRYGSRKVSHFTFFILKLLKRWNF
jgi:hypothetical protein